MGLRSGEMMRHALKRVVLRLAREYKKALILCEQRLITLRAVTDGNQSAIANNHVSDFQREPSAAALPSFAAPISVIRV